MAWVVKRSQSYIIGKLKTTLARALSALTRELSMTHIGITEVGRADRSL